MENTPTRTNAVHLHPSTGAGEEKMEDPPAIGRVRDPEILTQPPEIIPPPVVRANLNVLSWKLTFQDPLRQFKPRTLTNQPMIQLGRSREVRQYETQVAIKSIAPKAIE
jgi:hypothetical protein